MVDLNVVKFHDFFLGLLLLIMYSLLHRLFCDQIFFILYCLKTL